MAGPAGTKTDKGLGAYPDIGLGEARRKAKALRENVAAGRPAEAVVKVPTFATVAEKYITANSPTWAHPKTAHDLRVRLEKYVYPYFGDKPVNDIKRRDVLECLQAIWTTKSGTAGKVKQRIRAVFDYALDMEYIEVHPALSFSRASLPPQPTSNHFRTLPYADVPAALATIDSSKSIDATRLCFRWLVLTVARSGEARGARWQDIDLKGRTWTIPADRMKAGREHRVPLSQQAVDVLTAAMPLMDGSGLVFPGQRGQLSDMTLTKALQQNGLSGSATVHGFRTSFKTWCMETTDTPWAVGEAALAHTLGNSTEQAYARSDLFERRRELMAQWSDYLS